MSNLSGLFKLTKKLLKANLYFLPSESTTRSSLGQKITIRYSDMNLECYKINPKCEASQWAFTCSKLTIETLEQSVKYVQS